VFNSKSLGNEKFPISHLSCNRGMKRQLIMAVINRRAGTYEGLDAPVSSTGQAYRVRYDVYLIAVSVQ
jgi:hypothetical protein